MTSLEEPFTIAFADALFDDFAGDYAAVDEKDLVLAGGPGQGRSGNIAGDSGPFFLIVHRHQVAVLCQLADGHDGGVKIPLPRRGKEVLSVVDEAETDAGISQGDLGNKFNDLAAFRAVGLEKFPAAGVL